MNSWRKIKMQVYLLNTFSTWGFLLYITALITTMTTLIFLLVKHFVPASLHKQNKKLFTLSISIVIANYGFILGFIIINLTTGQFFGISHARSQA